VHPAGNSGSIRSASQGGSSSPHGLRTTCSTPPLLAGPGPHNAVLASFGACRRALLRNVSPNWVIGLASHQNQEIIVLSEARSI